MAQIPTCFNSVLLTNADKKELKSYEVLNLNLFGNHDKIADLAVFGQDYKCLARLNSDLLMLVLFFKMIYLERSYDVLQGNTYEWTYYSDKYCLEKVKDAFYCRGVIIDELENLWSLWDLNLVQEDGIGFMQIEGDETTYPIFRIED